MRRYVSKQRRAMRKSIIILAATVAAALFAAPMALAGSPHFVANTVQATVSGATISVSGKEAGLGDEQQVHIVLSATAECVNPGDHHPQAANKTSVQAAGDFPVQNGKALFSLSATAAFDPSCSPPMAVVFTSATVTDTTNGISESVL